MRTRNVSRPISLMAHSAAFVVLPFSPKPPASEIIKFKETRRHSAGNWGGLMGHWQKTTIGYPGPRDEHLVLHSNGTVENWTVTAYERREPVTGHWNVEGKTLTLSFGGNDRSS